MILILTSAEDLTSDLVEKELMRIGGEFIRLNTETYGSSFSVDFSSERSNSPIVISTDDRTISGDSISSVWYRRPLSPKPNSHITSQAAREFATEELSATIHGAIRALDVCWVSHPEAIRLATHKLAQLRVAPQIGFLIPKTLVSSDPAAIRTFVSGLESLGERAISKLVAKGPPRAPTPGEQYVVFTQLLSQKDLSNDESLRACPAIYQEYVNKQSELRVTVVGSKVFACEIHSQTMEQTRIDWRRYDLPNTPHRAYKLTTDIEAKCLAITRHFGLMFSTIDLVVRPDGQVVFLEMNPNGQWGWIEEMTGLPIARSIAELLLKEGA